MIRVVKERDDFQWHQWYAWYPLWISRGKEEGYYTYTYVWFERIWRKRQGSWGGSDWIYAVEKPNAETERS